MGDRLDSTRIIHFMEVRMIPDLFEGLGGPLQQALSLLATLGFEENERWGQVDQTYRGYTLPALIAECRRSKSPILEYITLAACVATKSELSSARILLRRVKNDTGYTVRLSRNKRREEMNKLRDFLETELAKLLHH